MNKDFKFDIQMFSEGGTEGAGDGTENASGLTGDFKADFERHVLGRNVPGKESAPVSQKNDAEASEADSGTETETEEEATAEESSAADDLENEFEDLIKGRFKSAFHNKTQGIINERFKNAKETEGKLKTAMDALAPLFDRYGIEEGDIEGLREAVKSDAGIFAKKALEKGIGSEEYRDAFNADRDRIQKEAEDEAQKKHDAAIQMYQSWKKQEAEIQKSYPAFELKKAFQNEDFRKMAVSGASLMNAYRASHFDEIAAGLVAAATKRAAKNAVDSMQGNVRRPYEGGMNSVGGTVIKKDVSTLTGKDIDNILTAVGRGDKISF